LEYLTRVTIFIVQTVLIVEDDVELRRMYRTALAFAGFDVKEAGNGLDALRFIDRDPPDLVVLDLGLPVMSGYLVREDIAAQAHTRNIPVVVVTGLPGDHQGLDVACVLRKPVTPEQLVMTVRSCIKSGTPGVRG
jgi:DNA-binding response OmpR family regulator